MCDVRWRLTLTQAFLDKVLLARLNELNSAPNPEDTDSEAESLDSSHGDASASSSSSPAHSEAGDDVVVKEEYEVEDETGSDGEGAIPPQRSGPPGNQATAQEAMDVSEAGDPIIPPLSPATPEESQLLDAPSATPIQVADAMSDLHIHSPQSDAGEWSSEPGV